jgi:hypothetical protein
MYDSNTFLFSSMSTYVFCCRREWSGVKGKKLIDILGVVTIAYLSIRPKWFYHM